MGSIGDIFFTAGLDDTRLIADAKKSGQKAGTALGTGLSGTFKKSAIGLVDGLKLGAGISAFGALDTAISSTIGFLGDAVRAAREDEESQTRLGAALRANVPNWDGNTAAIERTLESRMRLGFSDDEQRKSLAVLVVATNDVNKALDLQSAAMDLARLKGISLEEASNALIKVEGGQYRLLKALGIQLPKNATATEALAAVQKAAAGSAETFANTSQGKLLASQVKVGEAMEKLGYVLLPAVTDAMVFMADEGIPAILGVLDALGQLKAVIDDLGATQEGNPLDAVGNALVDFPYEAGQAVRRAVGDLADDLRGVPRASERAGAAMEQFAVSAGKMADDLIAVWPAVAEGAEGLGPALEGALGDAISGVTTGLKDQSSGLGRALGIAAAKGIVDSVHEKRSIVDDAWQDLLLGLTNQMSPTEERAKLLGRLASTKLIEGLHSKDPAVKAQAQLTRDLIINRLNELKADGKNIGTKGMEALRQAMKSKDPAIRAAAQSIYRSIKNPITPAIVNARAWGSQIGAGVAAGLRAQAHAVGAAAGLLANTIAAYLYTNSPAEKGPLSKLGGPDGWGAAVGNFFSEGLKANLPDLTQALGGNPTSLGSAVPSMRLNPATLGAAALAPVAAVTNYNTTANVTGLVKARDPLEIARQLQRFATSGALVRTQEPA